MTVAAGDVATAALVDLGPASAGLSPDGPFTADERRLCGDSSPRLMGRLAAKHAVLELLGLPASEETLLSVTIVPGPHEGAATPRYCAMGHRPIVTLDGDAAAAWSRGGSRPIGLSISHTASSALAVACWSCNPVCSSD